MVATNTGILSRRRRMAICFYTSSNGCFGPEYSCGCNTDAVYSFKNEHALSTYLVKGNGVDTIQSVRTHGGSENAVSPALGSFSVCDVQCNERRGQNNVALIYFAAATILNAFPDQEGSSY